MDVFIVIGLVWLVAMLGVCLSNYSARAHWVSARPGLHFVPLFYCDGPMARP